jgi:kinesin family protein 14
MSTSSTTTPVSKKVHFRKEVSKFSVGGSASNHKLNNQTNDETATTDTPKLSIKSKTNKENDNLITVGIRIRPLNRKEISQGFKNMLQISDDEKTINITDRTNQHHEFTCDHCFTEKNSSQENVFETIAAPLLLKSIDGYNTSVFAYGQTSSGKTYSMIGVPEDEGIIPRFIRRLFEQINKIQQDDLKTQIQCEISYYEIYNEKVNDLLQSNNEIKLNEQPRAHLKIREDPITGPYIAGLLSISCENSNDMLIWLNIGNKRRATACTNMNDKSSRSHSVFQINLKQIHNDTSSDDNNLQILRSKINLVDLAGSERLHNLQQHQQHHQQARFKESTSINKSLLTLGKIICLLSEQSVKPGGYLPYRDSALTWILKESLGGNAKTAMLATINCSSHNFDETMSTLRYASKTACIKNTAMLNKDMKYDLNELEELKKEHLNKINEIKIINNVWQLKLDEANLMKEVELKRLEKSMIVFNDNEKCSKNCCLINMNEDPLLSEKLIYLIKSLNGEVTVVGSSENEVDIYLCGDLIAPIHAKIIRNLASDELVIEQVNEKYVTYVNGELISEKKQLNHVREGKKLSEKCFKTFFF